MSVRKDRKNSLLSWVFIGLVVALCATLGVLQYRWIGQVSRVEAERLRSGLQARLWAVSQEFNSEVNAACAALVAVSPGTEEAGREEAYAQRYTQWRDSSRHNGLIRRVFRVVPRDGSLDLRLLNSDTNRFEPAGWPASWSSLQQRLASRLSGEGPRSGNPFNRSVSEELAVLDLPRFGWTEDGERSRFPGFGRPREIEWLLVELDLDYLRASVFPELLQRHLGRNQQDDYQVEIALRGDPSQLIYPLGAASRIGSQADASASLLDLRYEQMQRGGGPGPGRRGGFDRGGLRRTEGPDRGEPDKGPLRVKGPERRGGLEKGGPRGGGPELGRWVVQARYRAGSVEAVVERSRRRSLAVTGAVLLLMLGAIGALVRFTTRTRKLADLQMDFVTGVSHELRTPLSVIRAAAHNLGGGIVSDAAQVQRYGALIEQESERLTDIVEQVLQFSSAKAGRTIRAREPVSVDSLMDDAMAACSRAVEQAGCKIERQLEPGLPPVLGDPLALKHAVQNLLFNAAKYGPAGGWIGLSAVRSGKDNGMVEIRVADHGAGIPSDELEQVFEPFYRGKKAMEGQIHGTGLGLSLVKRIVEAHDGSVSVSSELGKGTEFVMRLPSSADGAA